MKISQKFNAIVITKLVATVSFNSFSLKKEFIVICTGYFNNLYSITGALMVVAWVIFASSGMLIARYTRPVGGDKTCFGQKIWFQVGANIFRLLIYQWLTCIY